MKVVIILIINFSLSFFSLIAQVKSNRLPIIFGGNILFKENEKPDCIIDLQNLIGSPRKNEIAKGIFIEKIPLENRTGQEFFLQMDGLNKAIIKYTCINSLNNAVYTLLDYLGYRWYGPGDNWFFEPTKFSDKSMVGKWQKPTFRNRSFFGTGGLDFGTNPIFDPENLYKKKWYAWKRRNRINADFEGQGHTGNAFYLENKKLLDANSNWFVNESGKQNGRIKIENANAVNAYKNWIKIKHPLTNVDFMAVGVEPEDGRGGADDPLPPASMGLKNYADKWWWLANEVAKDYPTSNPNIVVTAYAYGDGPYNALVPSFSLQKNVYPVIIPYAFQTAYLPMEMVQKWASAISGNMGLYDYWNITQWSLGQPQLNIYTIPEKLKFWYNNKVNGIFLETTDAAGPMGHAHWLTAQTEWDINKNFDSLFTQYLNDCFGKGASAMRKMFTRWSLNYQGAGEVALSLTNLKEASDAVEKNSSEWKRITELKAYVHYLKLFFQHNGSQESKNNIFNYLYSIHHLLMVQTSAFITQNYITPFDKGNIVPGGATKKLTEEEIEAQFIKDISENNVEYSVVDFNFNIDKAFATTPIDTNSWRFGSSFNAFFKAQKTETIKFSAGAESEGNLYIYTNDKILIKEKINEKNKTYIEKVIDRNWFMKTYNLNIVKGQTYNINFNGGFNRMCFPSSILILKNPGQQDFDNYAYPSQYFYVPLNAKEIIFYDAHGEGLNDRGYLITPDNKTLHREKTSVNDIYSVNVEPQYRGKVWKANFGHPGFKFLNIPNFTSLAPFKYVE